MKSMGMVRKLDNLGRIVLPAELRKQFNIADKDSIEIFTEEYRIILKKKINSCVFCNTADETKQFNGKIVCRNCIQKLTELI